MPPVPATTMTPSAAQSGVLRPTLPFVLLVAAILVLTVSTASHNFSQQREKEAARLQAISNLKAKQISDWLKDKQGDAKFVRIGQHFADNYRRWREAGDLPSRDLLQVQLEQFRQYQGFAAVTLLDHRGERLWGSTHAPLEIAPLLRDAIGQAAADHRIHWIGPYLGLTGTLCLDFVVPLKAVGAHPPLVVLHTDPTDWLYRTLQSWPVPSGSGETLLFRRDGNQVLYLNELRHLRDTALKLRIPVATPRLLAAQVLRGESGLGRLVEGVDYRGVPSMGVAQPILDTDWFLIAKLDRAEFYGEAAHEMIWIGLVGLLTLFMAAAGFNLLRQRHQLAIAAGVQQSQSERLHALRLLAAIADSSEDAIFAKDLEDRYTLFNQAACDFSGKPVEEVLGHDERAIFPPEQAERLMTINRQVISENRNITREEALDTPSGERVCLTTKGPLRDADGKVIGIFGIVHDITERKQAERALRDSEERFRALVEQSLAGIYIIQDGHFRYANPRFAALSGYGSPEALVDRVPVTDLVSPEDRERVAESLRSLTEGEASDAQYAFSAQRRDGSRVEVEAHGRAFVYQGRPAVIGLILDISARKSAENALLQQTVELAKRNVELERFNRAVVGRELDMIALKQQVNTLSTQLGQQPPFALSFLDMPAQPPKEGEAL